MVKRPLKSIRELRLNRSPPLTFFVVIAERPQGRSKAACTSPFPQSQKSCIFHTVGPAFEGTPNDIASSAGERWASSLRANQGHVCVSLKSESGDGATAGAEASHRAGHGSMSRKREGTLSAVAKVRRGRCPSTRCVDPASSCTIRELPLRFSMQHHLLFVFKLRMV
jgi:hypothetical protein